MYLRHLIIFFGLVLLARAQQQEASQNATSTTDVNHDPRRILGNRINRHNNWPPHRGRSHGPEVFQRMRQIEEKPSQQHEPVAVTDAPVAENVAVEEAPVQKNEQPILEIPSKIKGGSFEERKLAIEQQAHRENPWMRMHSGGPLMRPQAHFNNDAQPGMVHFSAGTAQTANENTETASQSESSTETQQKQLPQVFPHLMGHRQRFENLANTDEKLIQKKMPWNHFGIKGNVVGENVVENVPVVPESGNADDFNNNNVHGNGPLARGHFFNRFMGRGGPVDPAPALNTRDGTVIRMVNRPPDIIIRNTFQDRPKSFIDLRITIDENGVLNVEAGPQGVVRNRNSTSNVNQVTSNNADDHEQDEDMDLEEHWMRNRQQMKNVHHVSGVWDHEFDREFHGPMIRDKRVPFWVLRGPNSHPPRFGHGPLPMMFDEQPQQQQQVSEASLSSGENQNQHEQQSRSQNMISGASHPPIIPSDEMEGPWEPKNSEQAENNNNHQIQGISKLGGGNHNINKNIKDAIDEPIVNEMIQEATQKKPNSAHANDWAKEQPSTPEPEIKPVINIDDFSASGCPALNCPKQCPGGLTKLNQETGCPMCDCCPDIACRMTCPNGYDSDLFGCPICRCV